MQGKSRIIKALTLCAIMLLGIGCETSQKEFMADSRAWDIAEDLDRKLYLGLYQKEVVRATVREHLREVYVNDCDLR